MNEGRFHVKLSADFCDAEGRLLFPDLGLSLLEAIPDIGYEFLREYRGEYAAEQLANCDVLISLKPRVIGSSLAQASRLCAIGRCGVGYDNVDLDACTEKGIAVFITPGGVVRPVAESIVLFMLALAHNLVAKDRMVRQGQWAQSTQRLGREPRGRVVGTLGLGNIAAEAIRLLRGFDVGKFLAFDPYATQERASQLGVELVSLDALLRASDYVLVNCPLNGETRGLLGRAQFALMKPEAVLINTARGPIVDEAALVHALQTGLIRGAALDVFETEPLSTHSALTTMDNVILSSHSIAWTEELFRDMGRIDCEGALAVFRGQPPQHIVNPQVLQHPAFLQKLAQYQSAFAGCAMITFRQRLQQGELLLGQMILELFTPGIGPMLAACGLDFVIFDMEHGRCDITLLEQMVASCRGSAIFPIARVPDRAYAPLSRVLDVGARGVMVPRVETRQQAEDIVSQLKYAPTGRRGVAMGIAHDLYRAGTADFFAQANADAVVILMLETETAFANLDDIVSVPGVDIAWVGHYDLTVSMGIPAQFEHPRLLAAMDALVDACRRHGVAAGFLPPSPQAAVHWAGKGFRALSLSSDIGVLLDGVRKFRARVVGNDQR